MKDFDITHSHRLYRVRPRLIYTVRYADPTNHRLLTMIPSLFVGTVYALYLHRSLHQRYAVWK